MNSPSRFSLFFYAFALLIIASLQGPAPVLAQGWTQLQDAIEPRVEGHSTVIEGKLYTFGGFQSEDVIPTDQNEVYDPGSNTWNTFAPLPVPITHVGSALVGNEVWIVGGFAVLTTFQQIVDHVYIYNQETDTWTTGPPLPVERAAGALVRNGRKLHYFSGLENRNDDVPEHYVLDLDESGGPQNWTMAAPLPSPRNHLSGVSVGGKIYAIGGQQNHDVNPQDTKLFHVYDPVTDSWTRLPDLPYLRSHSEPGTFVVDGKIIIVGGKSGTNTCIDNVTQYDTQTGVWSELPAVPDCLLAPSSKVIADELFVSHGGKKNVFFPQTTLRKHNFPRSPSNVLDFYPQSVTATLNPGESEKEESVLFTLSDEASYSINTNNLPSWIASVTATSGIADIPGAEIDVTLDATGIAPGTYTHTLTATASGYQNATLTVEMTVIGNGTPALSVAPENTDFGIIPLGHTAMVDVTLSNSGSGAAALSTVDLDVQDGSVDYRLSWWDAWPAALNVGETLSHTANVTPTGVGNVEIETSYGSSNADAALFTMSATGAGEVIVRLNAGGIAVSGGSQSNWSADAFFEGGQTFQNPLVEGVNRTGTSTDEMYLSERSAGSNLGSFAYRIPVPEPGTYITRLHFAETYFGAPGGTVDYVGRRIFDVNLEEGPIELDDFDIAAEVGPLVAVVKSFTNTVLDGVLDIEFAASADQPKVTGIEVFKVDPGIHLAMNPGWNLISLPYNPGSANYQSLFPDLSLFEAPYAYTGQRYEQSETLVAGDGYWLETDIAGYQYYNAPGINAVTLNLVEGWQLVGGPACLFPVDQFTGDTGVILGDVLGYITGQGYVQVDQLIPGKGYWVEADGPGSISMNCNQVLSKPGNRRVTPVITSDDANELIFADATGRQTTLLLAHEMMDDIDLYNLPPYPPAELVDVRFTHDSRFLAGKEGIIRVQGMQGPISITLNGNDEAYRLDQLEGDVWVTLGTVLQGHSLAIDVTDIAYLRIRSQKNELPTTPSAFALNGIYPNPVQSTGTILLDVPHDGVANVEVFNMLGQQVASHETQIQAGTDRSIQVQSNAFAPGVYVYRLRLHAGGQVEIATGRFLVIR